METTARFFIELAYKGTAYHGWQLQANAVTVQEVVNKALSTFYRQHIETTGCGRTDTGVHAKQFYAHFDRVIDENEYTDLTAAQHTKQLNSLNALLPYDISVLQLIKVAANAHARFDASSRSYQYHIHFHKNPFLDGFSWLLNTRLDSTLMNEAAHIVTSYRDFSCFSKSNTQTFTNNCIIRTAEWKSSETGLIFYITADRFLRNMVRAIVGTLIRVGKKEIPPQAIRQIIEGKNRSAAGASVPACGLYLSKVTYPYIT